MRLASAVVAMLVVLGVAEAAADWTVEASLGAAHNLTTPLTLRQSGFEPLRLQAWYETRAFQPPLYYAARLTRWKGDRGWAMELVHHKLYLQNPPPQVAAFSISHGYNLIAVEHRWRAECGLFGLGVGAVVAHPENTVRGMRLSENRGLFRAGYYVAGPALVALAGRSKALGERVFAVAEIKLLASQSRVPVAQGHANVSHVSLHGSFGLGWRGAQRH
jgi:hypothetical protein